MPDADAVTCELCAATLPAHASYVVRIDVFADPSVPPITADELDEADPAQTMADLIEQLKDADPEALQDQVHRRFEYRICRPCQFRFLANPLGRPREAGERRAPEN